MSATLRKRSVLIAEGRGLSLNALIATVDAGRDGNLSSALRVFVLRELQGVQ